MLTKIEQRNSTLGAAIRSRKQVKLELPEAAFITFPNLVTYHVFDGRHLPPFDAQTYQYILTGDGVFVRAETPFFSAIVSVAACSVRGLAPLQLRFHLKVARIPGGRAMTQPTPPRLRLDFYPTAMLLSRWEEDGRIVAHPVSVHDVVSACTNTPLSSGLLPPTPCSGNSRPTGR